EVSHERTIESTAACARHRAPVEGQDADLWTSSVEQLGEDRVTVGRADQADTCLGPATACRRVDAGSHPDLCPAAPVDRQRRQTDRLAMVGEGVEKGVGGGVVGLP